MNTQSILENDHFRLIPLKVDDFEELYAVASDPLIWEQHPNKDRYKRTVFENFFKGAMQSGGAFKILDKQSGEIAGSTRFYDYDPEDHSILIGYTFYATRFWGKGINAQVKKLMLDYIFQSVDRVYFHVGKSNTRSRKAMEKLGATQVGERNVAYFGEPEKINVIYEFCKTTWTMDHKNNKLVQTIQGGFATDHRGQIRFVNDFDMTGVKRFYLIRNADIETIRGWRAHRIEQRWFYAVSGSFLISYVQIDNWEQPSKTLVVEQVTLRADQQQIIHFPAGYGTAVRALDADSELLVFADYGIDHASKDDYTYPADYWPVL